MKCETCQGRGFIEYEHGLVMASCVECGGTGEADVITLETLQKAEETLVEVVAEGNVAIYAGLYLELAGKQTDEYSDGELWVRCKKAVIAEMQFPHIAEMPCDKEWSFDTPESILSLPIKDVPCPCGNPNHYIVRFVDRREITSEQRDLIQEKHITLDYEEAYPDSTTKAISKICEGIRNGKCKSGDRPVNWFDKEREALKKNDAVIRTGSNNKSLGKVVEVIEEKEHLTVRAELTPEGVGQLKEIGMIGEEHGISRGTGQANKSPGSGDTGKPKKSRKPRVRKGTSKRHS